MNNLLPLETWRMLMGFHPFHFWQLAGTDLAKLTSKCNALVSKYAWQNADAAGRDDIIEAICNAEARLAQLIGYYPAPHWGEQTLEYPKYFDHNVWRMSSADGDGHWLTVRLKDEGYVQQLGIESLALIGTPALTFSDEDGDGLDETWTTAAVVTTETDTEHIAVYYAAADRLDDNLENWQILPVQITISGGSVVITGKAWQVVSPVLYEGVSSNGLDPTLAASFATTLDIYIRKNDPDGITNTTGQSTLIWESLPYPGWATCCGCTSGVPTPSTDPAAEAYAVARAGIRDSATGIVNFGRAAYNATTGIWGAIGWGMCRPPDRVTIRYRAGYPLVRGSMDRKFQVAVARLAAAELARPICACDTANRELYRWQFDLSRSGGANDEAYAFMSPEQLNNPLGMRRGHIYAWQFVQNYRNLIGFSF